MKKIIFLFLLLANIVLGQQKSDFEISGKLKIQIGTEILAPENVVIELFGEGKITTTDSQGRFKFKNLKSKEYNLRVLGYNFEPKNFSKTLINESIENFDLFIITDCQFNGEIAKKDIKRGKPRLLLIGGIAPVIQSGQEKFENKYKIEYSDFGCIPDPYECVVQYNKIIFKYLDNKYGEKWRKDVRKDVIGFE